jgi:hypothetical protein
MGLEKEVDIRCTDERYLGLGCCRRVFTLNHTGQLSRRRISPFAQGLTRPILRLVRRERMRDQSRSS